MPWEAIFHDDFGEEFDRLEIAVQGELLAMAKLLAACGPGLRRPHADTLNGSRYPNMKELRFEAAGGVRRVACAFDPQRRAILPVGGDKSGGSGRLFYKALIRKADLRYRDHLEQPKGRSPCP